MCLPGWIDLHAYVAYGVTIVVDTGTCGAGSHEALSTTIIRRETTRVLVSPNVSVPGLAVSPEHGSWTYFKSGRSRCLSGILENSSA